jgi:uncharacterized protein DUF6916
MARAAKKPLGRELMKRRKFVVQSIAAGTAALVAPNVAAAEMTEWQSRGVTPATASAMTRRWFEEMVNSHVLIDGGKSGPIEATIIAVSSPAARQPHWNAAKTDQFSVVFRVPADAAVQGLCWVSHAGAGRFQLFLDPVSRSGRLTVSQAHFGLLV